MGQNGGAIGLTQCALAKDHDAVHPGGGGVRDADLCGQCRTVGAQMGVIIGQIDRFADDRDLCTTRPRLADARVQNRGLGAGVGADEQNGAGGVDILDRGGPDIGRAVARRQFRAINAAFDRTALPLDQLFQRKGRLDRGQIAHQTGQLFGTFDLGSGQRQRLGPACRAQRAVVADIGLVQPLAAQAVPDIAGFVAQPFFVHAVMVARQDAHDFAALGVDANVRPQRVHHVDGFSLGQLPWPRGEGIGFRGQRAHRAQIDDIALQFRHKRRAQIAGDLCILAAPGLAHFGDAAHLGDEANATRAGNAARHLGLDQGAKVQIVGRPLGFAVAREIDAVSHRLILQIAFAALIANRAIERMIDQQKLHHAFARLFDHRAVGLDHRGLAFGAGAQIAHLHRARRGGFGRAAHHLDQTHPAIARNRQAFVITKARNFDPGLFTGLDQRHRGIDLDLVAVDDDLAQVAHGVRSFLRRGLLGERV